MYLYKIFNTNITERWDFYSEAIVIAQSPEEAKIICPCCINIADHSWADNHWTKNVNDVAAILIGVPTKETIEKYEEYRVVISSYHAG